MNSTAVALVSFACILGGTLLGLSLSKMLPADHLGQDSKEAVKIGAGMISMMAALVLGLLVSSAKQNFDSTNDAIVQGSAKIILLDRLLASYGPETKDLREHMRQGVEATIAMLWPEENDPESMSHFEKATAMEQVAQKIRELNPQTDAQRIIQEEAQDLCRELLLLRWLQIEQAQSSLPVLFLAVLLFWLSMLYISFGLFAPRNLTVITAMFIGALSLATAMFLILEMNRPMEGIIKASSAPMRKALEHLGR